MLAAGRPFPRARVWRAPREEAVDLRDALAGEGAALLCFYLWDWSPT